MEYDGGIRVKQMDDRGYLAIAVSKRGYGWGNWGRLSKCHKLFTMAIQLIKQSHP